MKKLYLCKSKHLIYGKRLVYENVKLALEKEGWHINSKMDNTLKYVEIVRKALSDFALDRVAPSPNPSVIVDTKIIFDPSLNSFLTIRMGWKDRVRVYLPIFHIDVKNNKIYIEHTASDYDIVGEIEAFGIPKSDIVLAFHSPYMRQFMEYAVA